MLGELGKLWYTNQLSHIISFSELGESWVKLGEAGSSQHGYCDYMANNIETCL